MLPQYFKLFAKYVESCKVEVRFENNKYDYVSKMSPIQLDVLKYGYQIFTDGTHQPLTGMSLIVDDPVWIDVNTIEELSQINTNYLSDLVTLNDVQDAFALYNLHKLDILVSKGYATDYLGETVYSLVEKGIYKYD